MVVTFHIYTFTFFLQKFSQYCTKTKETTLILLSGILFYLEDTFFDSFFALLLHFFYCGERFCLHFWGLSLYTATLGQFIRSIDIYGMSLPIVVHGRAEQLARAGPGCGPLTSARAGPRAGGLLPITSTGYKFDSNENIQYIID